MTDARNGRLYSARGASHPEAIPALAGDDSGVESGSTAKTRSPRVASNRASSTKRSPLTGAQTFTGVFVLTVAAVLVDGFLFEGPGLITTVVFVVVGLLGAVLVSEDGSWAGWSAPPTSLLVGLFTSGLLTSGAGVIGAAITVVEGLAANLWPVLGVFALSLLLGRRHQLLSGRGPRKAKPDSL